MAKRIVTRLLDDLDGTDADETLTFALDGIAYSIDLNSANGKKVRDFLDPYIQAGTRLGRVGAGAQLQKHRASVESVASIVQVREENAAIRRWALANGYSVRDRGAIPMSIREAFEKKLPNPATTVAQTEKIHTSESEDEPAPAAKKAVPAKKAPAAKKTSGSKVVSFSGGRKTA